MSFVRFCYCKGDGHKAEISAVRSKLCAIIHAGLQEQSYCQLSAAALQGEHPHINKYTYLYTDREGGREGEREREKSLNNYQHHFQVYSRCITL